MRIVLTGSEIDDPGFTKLLEGCGALVVADRYCYGSLPGREPIEIRDGETASGQWPATISKPASARAL